MGAALPRPVRLFFRRRLPGAEGQHPLTTILSWWNPCVALAATGGAAPAPLHAYGGGGGGLAAAPAPPASTRLAPEGNRDRARPEPTSSHPRPHQTWDSQLPSSFWAQLSPVTAIGYDALHQHTFREYFGLENTVCGAPEATEGGGGTTTCQTPDPPPQGHHYVIY